MWESMSVAPPQPGRLRHLDQTSISLKPSFELSFLYTERALINQEGIGSVDSDQLLKIYHLHKYELVKFPSTRFSSGFILTCLLLHNRLN